ncbi:T-box transcription factor tbx21, partial [Gryganskiella cystojenkinii]
MPPPRSSPSTLSFSSSSRSISKHPVQQGRRHELPSLLLVDGRLWDMFHQQGNEMIITKVGRCLFPCLRFRAVNLEPNSFYAICIDLELVDHQRLRFSDGTWKINPNTDNSQSQPLKRFVRKKSSKSTAMTTATSAEEELNLLGGVTGESYMHPDLFKPGSHWMQDTISFANIKLSNAKGNEASGSSITSPQKKDGKADPSPARNCHFFHAVSFHKYRPRVHLVKRSGSSRAKTTTTTYTFERTEFVAVTHYQNSKVNDLKKAHNPHAKGFHDEIQTTSPLKRTLPPPLYPSKRVQRHPQRLSWVHVSNEGDDYADDEEPEREAEETTKEKAKNRQCDIDDDDKGKKGEGDSGDHFGSDSDSESSEHASDNESVDSDGPGDQGGNQGLVGQALGMLKIGQDPDEEKFLPRFEPTLKVQIMAQNHNQLYGMNDVSANALTLIPMPIPNHAHPQQNLNVNERLMQQWPSPPSPPTLTLLNPLSRPAMTVPALINTQQVTSRAVQTTTPDMTASNYYCYHPMASSTYPFDDQMIPVQTPERSGRIRHPQVLSSARSISEVLLHPMPKYDASGTAPCPGQLSPTNCPPSSGGGSHTYFTSPVARPSPCFGAQGAALIQMVSPMPPMPSFKLSQGNFSALLDTAQPGLGTCIGPIASPKVVGQQKPQQQQSTAATTTNASVFDGRSPSPTPSWYKQYFGVDQQPLSPMSLSAQASAHSSNTTPYITTPSTPLPIEFPMCRDSFSSASVSMVSPTVSSVISQSMPQPQAQLQSQKQQPQQQQQQRKAAPKLTEAKSGMFSEAFVDADGRVVQGLPDLRNFAIDDSRSLLQSSSIALRSDNNTNHHVRAAAILESKMVTSTSSVISLLPYQQASHYRFHRHQDGSLEQQAELRNLTRENLRLNAFIRERYGKYLPDV